MRYQIDAEATRTQTAWWAVGRFASILCGFDDAGRESLRWHVERDYGKPYKQVDLYLSTGEVIHQPLVAADDPTVVTSPPG